MKIAPKRAHIAIPVAKRPRHSLYERLGGVGGIANIVTCLYERLLADPRIGGFWKGHSNERLTKERQSVIDLVCQGTGGPPVYQGADMRRSHDGLVIVEADWAVFSELATEAMTVCGIAAAEKQEVLAFFDSFKGVLDVKQRSSLGPHSVPEGGRGLSRREVEVLTLVAAGMNNPKIAQDLSISLNTVTRHLTNIFHKTGCSNRVEAAMYAARLGLVR